MERAAVRSEIRAQARGLDVQSREILYRGGDRTVRDALDETPFITVRNGIPRIEHFVTAEIRDDVALKEARDAMPKESSLLDVIRDQRELFGIVGAFIEKAIKDDAPGAAPADVLLVS